MQRDDDVVYQIFVNKVTSDAIAGWGNVRENSVTKKYEPEYGSNVYRFLERMKSEGRMLQVANVDGLFYVPFIDSQSLTISNDLSRPRIKP